MADTAAWLVDRVLRPDLRWRQVVVTFPAPIAIGLCFRARLASAVVRVCMRVLFDRVVRQSVFQNRSNSQPRAQGVRKAGRRHDDLGFLRLEHTLPDVGCAATGFSSPSVAYRDLCEEQLDRILISLKHAPSLTQIATRSFEGFLRTAKWRCRCTLRAVVTFACSTFLTNRADPLHR